MTIGDLLKGAVPGGKAPAVWLKEALLNQEISIRGLPWSEDVEVVEQWIAFNENREHTELIEEGVLKLRTLGESAREVWLSMRHTLPWLDIDEDELTIAAAVRMVLQLDFVCSFGVLGSDDVLDGDSTETEIATFLELHRNTHPWQWLPSPRPGEIAGFPVPGSRDIQPWPPR